MIFVLGHKYRVYGNFHVLYRLVIDEHRLDIREVLVGQLLRVFKMLGRACSSNVFGIARIIEFILYHRVSIINEHFNRCLGRNYMFDTLTLPTRHVCMYHCGV